MKHLFIPAILQKMNSFFKRNGFEAYLVGGAVRDMIRGREANDWDIATNASPQDVMRMFSQVIPTGIDHGTVTVHFMGKEIEVTTYRTESSYTDGRHPDAVSYAATIEEDLSRRDFTMNAIAMDLNTGNIVDPFDGITDIKKGLIRTVGNAMDRFSEDGLRPVRAVRFAGQLGFSIENDTFAAISRVLTVTEKISIERFRDEFLKMLMSPKPSQALEMMEKTGLLSLFIPELVQCRGITQADERGHHQFDVLSHLFASCDGASYYQFDSTIHLAALFHDIGKPLVRREEIKSLDPSNPEKVSPIITFYNHEKASAQSAALILERLRLPKKQINSVSHLIQNHMFHYENSWSDAAVRRFVVRTGQDFIDALFNLRYCDVYGMTGKPPLLHNSQWADGLLEFKERIQIVLDEKTALSLKDLSVNGKDLMERGIPSGKHLGMILEELFAMVVDNPGENTRENLLTIAGNLWKRYSSK
ncbi:MAG: HD domain-containing protein [Spirochaetaceae bacterium]|nr:HD domain-containing protein [Spirochaetaceae bacterium]